MKAKQKQLIIVAVAVAVAAYFIWKNSKAAKDGGSDTPAPAPGGDKTSLDYILTHVTFNTAERQAIESKRQACAASDYQRQSIQAKANCNGYSFDQQLVLDVIWNLYTQDGQWVAGPDGSASYGWYLQQKVLKL